MGSFRFPNYEDSDAFRALCSDYDVGLDEILFSRGNTWAEDGTPTGILAAIKKAGEYLREDPNRCLSDSLINPSWGFSDDVATRSLIDILNATVERPSILERATQFNSLPAEKIDTCSRADLNFLQTIVDAEYMSLDQSGWYGCQIFTNQSGLPVFFRKGLGYPSAISLKDVYVNGIPYPAGSYFSLEADDNSEPLPEPNERRVDEIFLRRIGRISFLRLSAFALPPVERQVANFHIHERAKDYEAQILREVELSDLNGSVLSAVEQFREAEELPLAANF